MAPTELYSSTTTPCSFSSNVYVLPDAPEPPPEDPLPPRRWDLAAMVRLPREALLVSRGHAPVVSHANGR